MKGNDDKKIEELKELKELIINGLKYIEFPEKIESKGIDVNLIIEIRRYLLNQTIDWYIKKFKEAYEHDIGITRKKDYAYYSDDGIQYKFKDNMILDSCVLYKSSGIPKDEEEQYEKKFDIKEPFSFHFYKCKYCFKYCYINEIDHFFTHCINNYLIELNWNINDNPTKNDRGLILVKEKIEEFKNKNS